MVVGLTGWMLGALDLRTLAVNIEQVNGWESFPSLKGGGNEFSYLHGEDLSGRAFYRAKNIDLAMLILATNAAGVVTSTPQQHVDENLATLFGALHSSSAYLTLTKTLYPSTARTIQVRPVDIARVDQKVGLSRAVLLSLRTGYPFWHGAAFSSSAGSGTTAFNNLGNAPINDMVITFTGAGRITNNLNGDWVESSAAGVVLNVGTGEVTTGSPGAINSNRPWYLQLEPGSQNLARTASIVLDGFYGYF